MKMIAAAALMAVVSGCSDSCQNSAISTSAAPSGDLKAVLFQRDCGSTTGFSTQVSVTRAHEALSGAGNAFVADTNRGSAKAASWGGPWLEMRWLSPQALLIRYDAKARVFTQNTNVLGVTVTYEKVPR